MSRSNSRRAVMGALIAAATTAAAPVARAGAQVTVQQVGGPLNFGTLYAGTPSVTVPPFAGTDARGRAAVVFAIQGPANGQVDVRLVAGTSLMRNGAGQLVALSAFTLATAATAAGSGAVSVSDPATYTRVTLSATGAAYVSIGATALPSGANGKGSYAALDLALQVQAP